MFVNTVIYGTILMLGCVYMKQKWMKYSGLFLVLFCITGSVHAAEETINCGADIIGIPVGTVRILNNAYNLLKIGTPLILVVMGIVDFARAVIGSNEDDIKKKQRKFIKRIAAAVLVFLSLAIVQWVFGILASAGFIDARGCINAILNGS